MSSLEALFCHVDDFCATFEPQWHSKLLSERAKSRKRARRMFLSEIMTILITFHQNHYRNFKHYYLDHVCVYWKEAFPRLPSYQRFVEWMPSTLLPLCVYLKHCFGQCTGISFLDATAIKVCHNRRISPNRVFKNLAARGRTSVDWFFGFKLHLVVNEQGELLNLKVTPGNTDDRQPVPDLLKFFFGQVFADRGYVSQSLSEKLFLDNGIEFFAKPRSNMKNCLMRLNDKLLSRKRSIIETIIDEVSAALGACIRENADQLKNISQIEHSRHRSPVNFAVNLLCGLIAYSHQPKKPLLHLD